MRKAVPHSHATDPAIPSASLSVHVSSLLPPDKSCEVVRGRRLLLWRLAAGFCSRFRFVDSVVGVRSCGVWVLCVSSEGGVGLGVVAERCPAGPDLVAGVAFEA